MIVYELHQFDIIIGKIKHIHMLEIILHVTDLQLLSITAINLDIYV